MYRLAGLMDVHDRPTRSYNMSRVRGKDTKPEMQIRRICHGLGFRYRLHRKDLPGRPDLVFPRFKSVILINGCFWHGHACELFKVPATRAGFWSEKIAGNMARDRYNVEQLINLGWRVLTVWECALKGRGRLTNDEITEHLRSWLYSTSERGQLQGKQLEA